MLRWTNRLSTHVASHGYATYRTKGDTSLRFMREVEFLGPFDSTMSEVSAEFSGLDGWKLKQLLADPSRLDSDTIAIHPVQSDDDRLALMQGKRRAEAPTGDETVEILWLSPTEFVSTRQFGLWSEQYTIKVWLRGDAVASARHSEFDCSLRLHAYSIFQFHDDGTATSGPPPELPLRFLFHLGSPMIGELAKIELDFGNGNVPNTDSVLALVPAAVHDIKRVIDVSIVGASTEILRALHAYPFHRNVRLRLVDGWIGKSVPDQVLNDHLRQFQRLRSLLVPYRLLNFASAGSSFASNEAFESLTIAATTCKEPSLNMLRGMVNNKNLKQLNIQFFFFLTPAEQQENFDRMANLLASKLGSRHGLSSLLCSIENITAEPLIKGNHALDTHFSPALVLNWLRCQQISCHATSWKIWAINRGLVYRKATNLAPFDLSVSSASIIFDTLREMSREATPTLLTEPY
jgi:hypothetical protein